MTENSQITVPMIYCAYTNIQPSTLIALEPYVAKFADCSGDKWAYTKYFQDRWAEGDTFINVEHDICFWPGAIESLAECPHDWCWFDDQWGLKTSEKNYARFGLTKLSATLISQTQDVWNDLLRRYEPLDPPSPWNMCDTFFFDYARDHANVVPHEHKPGTINVNLTYYASMLDYLKQELSCSTG